MDKVGKVVILPIGNICSVCKGVKFSISSGDRARPPWWPSHVLGALTCNCKHPALVALAPELEGNIGQALSYSGLEPEVVSLVLKALFRGVKKVAKYKEGDAVDVECVVCQSMQSAIVNSDLNTAEIPEHPFPTGKTNCGGVGKNAVIK